MSVRKRQWKTSKGITTVWQVVYADQRGERCSRQFDLKKEAEDYHATVHVDVRKGLHISPSKSPTMSKAAEGWYARVEANGMRDDGPAERTTLRQYRQHIDLHINPRIGTRASGN